MLYSGALNTSATGIQAASSYLDVVSNNIANASTTGYKTATINFEDLLYTGLQPGAQTAGDTPPGPIQYGSGTAVSSVSGLFNQGTLTPTGNTFDVGISGPGFLQVTLPDGTTGYTRAGNLTTNANGQLVSSEGYIVSPPLTVPPGASSITIGNDGTVTAVTSTGTQTLGQITLAQFANPGGLERVGDTTFVATPASGATVTGVPGTNGLGSLEQGQLENSNVDLPNELINLLVAQSSFLYNTQAFQAENETLTTTEELIPIGP